MRRALKIIRTTACCLLGLYFSAIIGFVVVGMVHSLQHAMAESRLPQALNSAQPIQNYREAGCKPAADIASNNGVSCPGCSKQQKSSTTIVKYYHVFNFCSSHSVAVHYAKQGARQYLTHSDQNDQTPPQPLAPPPKRFSA